MQIGPKHRKSPLVTFEEAELNTLRQGQALTAEEKLRWLEEAENLTLLIQQNRFRQGLPVDPKYREFLSLKVAEDQSPYRASPPHQSPGDAR